MPKLWCSYVSVQFEESETHIDIYFMRTLVTLAYIAMYMVIFLS